MVVEQDLERRLKLQLRDFTPDQVAELAGAVRRLVDAFKPERIFLFGSHARGEAGPNSDVDLLVLMPWLAEPAYRLASAAYAELASLHLPFEVQFMTRADFEARLPAPSSLPASVAREGLLLYAA